MGEAAGAGDREHHGGGGQQRGERDLLDGCPVPGGGLLKPGRVDRIEAAAEREKRHERGTGPGALRQQRGVRGGVHVERVLHGGDRGDRAGPGELCGVDVADAQVPDQARLAQLRQRGEPLGDRFAAGRVLRADPQVDQVEPVNAELAEVVLRQAAELGLAR